PLYVARIEAQSRRVVVGPVGAIERSSFNLLAPHWVDGAPPLGRELRVRIRHRHAGAAGSVEGPAESPGAMRVRLDVPARAVTPGPAAVLHDGARVLGGGWIA